MQPKRIHTVPDPDSAGRIRASFAGYAPEHPETINDPRVVGGTRQVDRVWMRYEEGEREGLVGLVRWSDIDPPLI
jgi:hypothetical protein